MVELNRSGSTLVIEHRTQFRLRENNLALQQALAAAMAERSNSVAQSNTSSQKHQSAELAKLRSELGALRKRTNDIERLRRENEQLRVGLAGLVSPPEARDSAMPEAIPRESWAFVGYATPAAALQSAYWAAREGDLEAILASVTAEARERIAEELANLSESEVLSSLRDEMGNIKELRLRRATVISESEVFLNYDAESENQGALMIKVGNDWKFNRLP